MAVYVRNGVMRDMHASIVTPAWLDLFQQLDGHGLQACGDVVCHGLDFERERSAANAAMRASRFQESTVGLATTDHRTRSVRVRFVCVRAVRTARSALTATES
jgi:hypothetical protein